MKRAARAVLLLLPLLSACSQERPSAQAYLAVVPQMVEFMEADARRTQPGQPATGPLIVDLPSFAFGGRGVTGQRADTTQLRAAIGKPFESIPYAQADSALLCDPTGEGTGCWVKQYGVYVKLNQARSTADRITALLIGTSTNRTIYPTRICDRIWRLVFLRRGERWELTERNLRQSTCVTEEIPVEAAG